MGPASERADSILHAFGGMASARFAWEQIWREIDDRVNPVAGGAFNARSPGKIVGEDIFDHTGPVALDRFQAAVIGMIAPRGERYHYLKTTDAALNEMGAMKRWLEIAVERIFAMRYAPSAGFDPEAGVNARSLGTYGNGPLWIDHWQGRGMFYKCLHMSEVFVDEDFRGRIDTVFRKFSLTARQYAQMFDGAALPQGVTKAIENNRWDEKFDVLHVIRPRKDLDQQRLDFRRMPIESIYVDMTDKVEIREGGYATMPIAFSRYARGPREIYGRSPAMTVLGTIRTANEISKTLMQAGHMAVRPPLLTPEDGVLSRIQLKPGGTTAGGMDFMGRRMVEPLYTGAQLPIGMEMLNNERAVIRDAFLEKVWSLLLERKDRMTATEVLEITRLQGMMLSPTASRLETEWLDVQVARELDIGMQTGYIPSPPPEYREAGASIKVIYDNPLSRAAQAEEAVGFARYIETLTPLAGIVGPEVYDIIDTDAAPRGLAEALAVRQRWLRSPEAVVEIRTKREEQQAVQQALTALPDAARATRDLAAARAEETAYAA